MTEYELADLFATWSGVQEETVQRFIALLFAFLIAAYLVSAKLKPVIIALVLLPYSYMALRYIFFYLNIADDLISLTDLIMQMRTQSNTSLGWLNISPSISTLLYSQAAAMFLSYLASLVVFFYMRKESKADLDLIKQS
jgi:hypothetical protein